MSSEQEQSVMSKLLLIVLTLGITSACLAYTTSTIVQSVDQPLSGNAGTWSHAVEEAGDYQIGVAWVEVAQGGEGVTIKIEAGDKLVKTITAPPGSKVTRLETRLEGLTASTVVKVSAIPAGGSKYRIGYKLAYGTPIFTGLATFLLSDFGAIGDGKSNDLPAIQKAIKAASKAGGGIIRFDGSKTYYIKGGHCFDLHKARNIKIQGEGARIVMHPDYEFAVIDDCENIQIERLSTTYDPLPYFQGYIKKYIVTPDDLGVIIEVPRRYPVPKTGKFLERNFGRSFTLRPGTKRTGTVSPHLYIDTIEALDDEGYTLRVKFRHDMKARLLEAKNSGATELVVPDKDFGQRTDNGLAYCKIKGSGRVTLSDITVDNYCNMGFGISDNWGPVTFTNVDIQTPKPETELFVGWRDGWHVHANRFGLLVQDSIFDGGLMYDDVISPYQVLPNVTGIQGNKVNIKGGRTYTWQPGDWISFWDSDQMNRKEMARLVRISSDGKGDTLEFDRHMDMSDAVYAMNEDTWNRDMEYRNCQTTALGKMATVRLRCPITFTNCKLDNIHFFVYSGKNRTRPRDVLFTDTYLWDTKTFNVDNAWDITFRNCVLDKTIVELDNVPRAIFDNVKWINSTEHLIKAEKDSVVHILGHTSRNGKKDVSRHIHNIGSRVLLPDDRGDN
jgi:hypothetical protein